MFRSIVLSLVAVMTLASPVFADEKPLVIASNPTWPPMEFLDENKQIIGYDRDIMQAIADEVGLQVTFRNTPWDGIFATLESGQTGIIASCVTITDKRKKSYLFSEPYYEVRQALVVAKDSSITKPEDLEGKTIGVQIGTTAVEALRKMDGKHTVRTYDEVGLVFEDMRNGRLDAVMCDDPVARYYASRKKGYENTMKVAFLTKDAEYIGFVMRKDDAKLVEQVNKGLATIRANGKEKAIRSKWLGE
ncbi:MAG: basic amino acid ABC transporter substrate-binding protein [Bilophila sp.]